MSAGALWLLINHIRLLIKLSIILLRLIHIRTQLCQIVMILVGRSACHLTAVRPVTHNPGIYPGYTKTTDPAFLFYDIVFDSEKETVLGKVPRRAPRQQVMAFPSLEQISWKISLKI